MERRITPINQYDQSIFGSPRERGYGFSNVHDVFRRTSPELVDYIAAFYGSRCAHIPDNSDATGVIVEEKTSRIVEHYAKYVSQTLQIPLEVEDISTLNGIHKGALVVPFINTTHVEQQFRSRGLEVWGLPGNVVDIHKNKADCHDLINELSIPGIETPDHRIVQIDQFNKESHKYLKDIRQQYEDTGMDDYPVGLMIRSAESDGNYGGCFVRQVDNGFTLTKNGSDEEKLLFASEEEALKAAHTYLSSTGNAYSEKEGKVVEPRVVVSRLMDLADSPGQSAVILNGDIVTLPWNGQVQEENSTACSGTTSYAPGTEYLREIHRREEVPTTEAFTKFIDASLQKFGHDKEKVNAVINVDYMIPGPREVEFQRRLKQKAGITIAEINPRFTNWTDALLFVAGANQESKSINTIMRTIDAGVYTQDKFHFPEGTDMSFARTRIAEIDHILKAERTRVLVRMIDEQHTTMGLVFSGDIAKARKELDNLASTI